MENTTTPTVSAVSFITDVNNGLTKNDLITKYNISEASVKEIANKLGVSVRRYVAPKYILDFTGVTEVNAETTPTEPTFDNTATLSEQYTEEPTMSNSL